ncbi:PAS domain-containing hybrid sensor histidine kinase/response regulator [Thermoflavifilum thermophilum]|nr:ATP-binding protein [Thermoflavifilum thermophilum]
MSVETAISYPADMLANFPLIRLIEQSSIGFLLSDASDRFCWQNAAMEEAMARTFPDVHLIGSSFSEGFARIKPLLKHPDEVYADLQQMLFSRTEKAAYDVKLAKGGVISLTYLPLFEGGQYVGGLWAIVNLNRKGRAYQIARLDMGKFRTILGYLGIGFCECTADGIITHAYDGFCELTGFNQESLRGKNIAELISREVLSAATAHHPTAPSASKELTIRTKDGSERWVLMSRVPLSDESDQDAEVMYVFMDITPQKTLLQEMETVARRTEESKIALQQFLASMSHEIRTPLNAIIGMSHLLSGTRLSPEQKEYVHILQNSSNILLNLISDILSFSKIESGHMEIQHRQFNLYELVHSLTHTFELKMKKKPVKMILDYDNRLTHYLIGDDILLNQVLLNLLSNAEKFTKKGSIQVSVKLLDMPQEQKADDLDSRIWLQFKVADTGMGIEPDKMHLIFKEFKQAHRAESVKLGGTGLGLSISKKLIELQGGTISVESEVNKGTCFTFTLPFIDTGIPTKQTTEVQTGEDTLAGMAFRDTHVLVVEDNPMNMMYLTSLLDKMKITYDVATAGDDALDMIRKQPYNLILMDIKIPVIDGLEISRIVRSEDENPNIATPIVLITAAALESTVNMARESGINDLLLKPFTPEQLLHIIRKYSSDDENEEEVNLYEEVHQKMYRFNPRLDVNYLQELYENNIEYAAGLFGIFMENIHADWNEIIRLKDLHDVQNLYQAIHKIKPNFSMVGLTWIAQTLEQAEKAIRKEDAWPEVESLLLKADKELEIYLPVVEEEYQHLQKFVQSLS